VNDAPEASADNVTISEQGLEFNNSSDSVETSGSFTVDDSDNDNLTVSLEAPTAEFTSNGKAVVWTTNEDGDLIGSTDDTEVIRITLGNVSNGEGTYTVTLSEALDQEGDSSTINFGLVVNDGEESTTELVTVTVEDDSPSSSTTTVTLSLSTSESDSSLVSVLNELTGTVNTDAGADGLGYVVTQNIIDGNGTFVLNNDGSYSFTPSDSFIESLTSNSGLIEYSYTVVDSDGDSVDNTLAITVNAAGVVTIESVTVIPNTDDSS